MLLESTMNLVSVHDKTNSSWRRVCFDSCLLYQSSREERLYRWVVVRHLSRQTLVFHISKPAFTHLVSQSISHMSDVNSHPNLPSSLSLTAMTANPILDWADTQKETDEWRPSPFLVLRHTICKSRYPFQLQTCWTDRETHTRNKK